MMPTADYAKFQRLCLAALMAALVLRLIWGFAIPILPVSDSGAYDTFAQNIANGNGYGWEPNRPSAYWPVGASAIYALLFRLFGHNYLVVMLFQVIVGVAVVALAMALAKRWFGAVTAVATGWILACWPLLIQYTTILASELYFLLFLMAAFWLASIQSRSWIARALGSGVALAAASYVRPTALVMAPLVFLRDAVPREYRTRALLGCIVASAAMAACILPWSIRNWHVFERVVIVSTNGGANLWMGNNPKSDTGYMELPELNITNEADRDSFLGRQARDYIVQDPVAFLGRMIRKVIRLHDRESIGVVWNSKGIVSRLGERMITPLKVVSSAYWLGILAAAIYGVFRLGRRFGMLFLFACPPIATWAYFTIVHGVTVAGDRYHVPSIPFIAMLAAYAVSAGWTAIPGRNSAPDGR